MPVMIEDDTLLEFSESLTVSLSLIGVLDSVELSQHTATIVITDDDGNGIDILAMYVVSISKYKQEHGL